MQNVGQEAPLGKLCLVNVHWLVIVGCVNRISGTHKLCHDGFFNIQGQAVIHEANQGVVLTVAVKEQVCQNTDLTVAFPAMMLGMHLSRPARRPPFFTARVGSM